MGERDIGLEAVLCRIDNEHRGQLLVGAGALEVHPVTGPEARERADVHPTHAAARNVLGKLRLDDRIGMGDGVAGIAEPDVVVIDVLCRGLGAQRELEAGGRFRSGRSPWRGPGA